MLKIDMQSNIKKVIANMTDLEKKDLPYIERAAANNLAFDAMRTIKKEIGWKLNIRKKKIPNSFRVKKATKQHPYATLYVDELSWQHKVLAHHFYGYDRERKGMEKAMIYWGYMHKWEILTPSPGKTIRPYVYVQMMAQLKLDYKSGYDSNETKRSRARSNPKKTKARFFVITGKSKSPMAPGVYARMPGHDKPICMLRISEKPTYKKRFDLEKTVSRIIARRAGKHFSAAMSRASSIRKAKGW